MIANRNTQIDAYRLPREPKYHELELLDLISKRHPGFHDNMLDIGCAAGAFIELMSTKFPEAHYTGFDVSAELIELAKKKLTKLNHKFIVGDALTFSPEVKYEIIIASGVLSIFEKSEEPLTKWLSWLDEKGVLYLFGRFNSRDIDTIIRFRNNKTGGDWEGGLTAYSVHTVRSFLAKNGYKCEFIRFVLPIALSESDDPIRTFTRTTTDGELLVLNGANLIAEYFFLIIEQKS